MASVNNFHQTPRMFEECPLQIITGPQKTILYVHPGLLSSCGSPVLKARVKDGWSNNETNKLLDWTDFDVETVKCVLSYLYTGDYHVACPPYPDEQLENCDAPGPMCSVEILGVGDQTARRSSIFTQKRSAALDLRHSSEEPFGRPLTPVRGLLKAGVPAASMQTAAGAFTKREHALCEDLGHLAVAHAKVYCFANYFLFRRLGVFAIQRLTQLLDFCNPTDRFLLDLKDAIHLVYSSTLKSEPDDPARELLSQYVAVNCAQIPKENLKSLIGEGGDFMIDFSHKMSRSIATNENLAGKLQRQISWSNDEDVIRKFNDLQQQTHIFREAEKEILEWKRGSRELQ
ncbi:unnamed protein product [Penicillium salamii]|uniref:BTB domain-containing protein n=1 Tax=Penicillium salamii TaxID=1612424 RepID=A0A9W4IJY7_9EURO|nr:unnamed protein product [Penicillium salamii]CAG8294008.1 unnamed protein product [Penicillium salamii]CAG8402119.1 unnamed protein product [Penicillium salamii]CAG8421485.1 unnamed protein product [Penicillium salamii]